MKKLCDLKSDCCSRRRLRKAEWEKNKNRRMAAVVGLFRQNLFLSHCCKAFAAVNRSVVRGSKGDLCFLAALCADCGVHFSGSFGSFLLLVSARLASLGLVLESA